MKVELNLCGPPGEATRRELERALTIVKEDNRLIINACLNSGIDVPDDVWDMGVVYNPPNPEEANTAAQGFYCYYEMLKRGEFSCGDAAAYEAAIQEEVYGRPTVIMIVPQGAYDYHAIYVGEDGPVDPTDRWLKRWAQANGRRYVPPGSGANRWGSLR